MFIGEKKIKSTEETKETTPGGIPLIRVLYEDGTTEYLSKKMHDEIVSKKATGLSELRDMRVRPLVAEVLALTREWGLKIGETPYFGQLLNQSLNFNIDQAELELWGKWMPKPKSRDDVSLTDVDRILKNKEFTLDEILGE